MGRQYAYDAFGRRVAETYYVDGVSQTRYYVYDGDRVVEELDGDGNLQASYVYGQYVDEVLQMRRDTNEATAGMEDHYYLHDDLYNVLALTDGGGNVVERYGYGDYGAPTIADPAGVPHPDSNHSAYGNPFLFNGRQYDETTGFYYYRTRYMEPLMGRFISRDTIGLWGDANNLGNPYTFVGNNPWSRLDPFGEAGDQLDSDIAAIGGNATARWGVANSHVDVVRDATKVSTDDVHNSLAIGGTIPGVGIVFDGTNVAFYFAEGRVGEAVTEAASFIPGEQILKVGGAVVSVASAGYVIVKGKQMTVVRTSVDHSDALAKPGWWKRTKDYWFPTPKTLPGPLVPSYHLKNFTDGVVVNRQVSGSEVFYKYHGKDNRLGKTHNYVTKKMYSSESELRNDLAILDEWGIEIDRVTTFQPPQGTWISEGSAAEQVGSLTGEVRPGRGYQGLIDIKNLPKSSWIRTDLLPKGFKR